MLEHAKIVEAKHAEAVEENLNLKDEKSELEEKYNKLEAKNAYTREIISSIGHCVIYFLATIIVCGFFYYLGWDFIRIYLDFFPALIAVGIPVPGLIRLLRRSLDSMENVQSTHVVRVVNGLDRFFWWGYGFIGVSILGALIWESVKGVFSNAAR